MTYVLPELSEAISALCAAAAPWLTAIRVGPGQHVTGIVWGSDLVVTTDLALPPHDSYTLVLSSGMLAAARPFLRDTVRNLAALRLGHPIDSLAMAASTQVAVGSLVLVLGADFDGTPTVRLSLVHRKARAAGQGVLLDLPETRVEPGALVVDPAGGVVGLLSLATGGEATVVPFLSIARFMEGSASSATRPTVAPPRPLHPPPRPVSLTPVQFPGGDSSSPRRPRPPPDARPPDARPPDAGPVTRSGEGRAWLGVALQPITVPEPLVARAGQSSGRLVVSISTGGPAERAGLRVGDVVLALNGQGTSGPHALRAFLDGTRIGSQVEVRVLRETTVFTASLTIAGQP